MVFVLRCLGGDEPEIFFKAKAAPDYGLLKQGIIYLAIGATILFSLSIFLNPVSVPTAIAYYIFSLMVLIALSQMLHFGLLNLNAFSLQLAGFPAYTLFRSPLRAGSLSDFWGKRWNIPFTEMTSIAVYRSLLKRIGQKPAFLFSFFFSGLLHEVALSVPVNTGFGKPMLYFCFQLVFTMAEKIFFREKKPGTIWVIACLLLPLHILFHPAIMSRVFWKILL